MGVDSAVPAAASNTMWWRQPHSDVLDAAEKLKKKLRIYVRDDSFNDLAAKLDDIRSADDSFFTLPGTRSRTIEVLHRVSAVLDALPAAAHYAGTAEELLAQLKAAYDAQAEIVKALSKRLPDNSLSLYRRHANAVLVFIAAILAVIAVTYIWPSPPGWFRVAMASASAVAPFAAGRYADATSIARPNNKRLHAFADAVIKLNFKREVLAVWNTVITNGQEARIAALQEEVKASREAAREESSALKAQLVEQNAHLKALFELLSRTQAGECRVAANDSPPSPPAERWG